MNIPPHVKLQRPSEHLEQYGEIIPNSYYECSQSDGILSLGDDVFRCNFEIAYMQNGLIFAVVYTIPDESNRYLTQILSESISAVLSLKGTDHQRNAILHASINTIVEYLSVPFSKAYRLTCIIDRFEAQFPTEITLPTEPTASFRIRNLPLFTSFSFDSWKYKHDRNLNSFHQKMAVDATISSLLQNRNEEITDDELLQIAQQAAFRTTTNEYRQKLTDTPSTPFNVLPIFLETNAVAELSWVGSYRNRKYDTQALTDLTVFLDKLPDNWDKEELVDWICNLLSMALGREIAWNYYSYPVPSATERKFVGVWRSRTISTETFSPYTEEHGMFDPRVGLVESSNSLNYLHDALKYLSSIPSDARNQYHEVLSYYIKHSATDSIPETKMAMLCMLGERIYTIWGKVTATKAPAKFTRKQSQQIKENIETQLQDELQVMFKQLEHEAKDDYDSRIRKLIARIINPLNRPLREATLREKYELLFEEYGWQLDIPFRRFAQDQSLRNYIKQFVDSRNNLAHQHEFATQRKNRSEDDYQKMLRAEIQNIEMFIPILLATILGYKGKFWIYYNGIEHSNGIWHYMPEHEMGHRSISSKNPHE